MSSRLALAVPAVVLIVAGLPTAAVAAPADPAKLEAVTEIVPGEMWTKVTYPVHRGATVRAPLGVISVDRPPVRGLVAEVRAVGDLEFAEHFRNCWYTTNAGDEIAWCEFDATLPGYGGMTIETPMVAAEADAEPRDVHGIPFRWASSRWARDRGGLRKVVDYFKGPGAAVTRGTGGTLGLSRRALPMADIRVPGNSVPVILDLTPAPSGSGPTGSASTTTAPTTAGPDSVPGADAGTDPDSETEPGTVAGVGLPVTGNQAGVAVGLGIALLICGVAGFVAAGRRRPDGDRAPGHR
jgi:hypothetical protein